MLKLSHVLLAGRGAWGSLMVALACSRAIGYGRQVHGRSSGRGVQVVDGKVCPSHPYQDCS